MLVAFFFGFKHGKNCASGEFLLLFHSWKLTGSDRTIAQESRQPAEIRARCGLQATVCC